MQNAAVNGLDSHLADPARRIGAVHLRIERHSHLFSERGDPRVCKVFFEFFQARAPEPRYQSENGPHGKLCLVDRPGNMYRAEHVDSALMNIGGNSSDRFYVELILTY